jgi:hypothetical protein
MTIAELADALTRPTLLHEILGEYEGDFSIGVAGTVAQPAISLRVQTGKHSFPESVEIDGEIFPLHVEEGFVSPTPLGKS